MYQDHEEIFTVRTLACDICDRFDSVLLTKDELNKRVSSNSLQIGSKILSHNDHLRIVYFDIGGKYLGDTMSLNFSPQKQLVNYTGEIPYLLKENATSISLHKKMLRYFINTRHRITIIGPSMAGKTSLTLFLESGLPERVTHRVNHSATMGKSVKHFKLANNQLTVMDMGGQKDFWGLWGENISSSNKIIFVLDGTANNLDEIINALQLLISNIGDEQSILLIHNKMDLFLEGYANSFISPDQLLSKIDFPQNIDHWIIDASIYNGLVYNYNGNNDETSLSIAILDFLNR